MLRDKIKAAEKILQIVSIAGASFVNHIICNSAQLSTAEREN